MLVDEIYHSLRTVDPKLSISRFCVEYLDTSRSYLFSRRNKDKDVSAEVLLNLYGNLRRSSATFSSLAEDTNRPAHWIDNFQRKAMLYLSFSQIRHYAISSTRKFQT